jgi:hypothetical protein
MSKRLNFWERSLKNSFFVPIFAAACLLLGTATAQTIVSYTSPIADYQPFVDEKIISWKAANDKVGQIGGWRAYAKEAQQPDNTSTPSQNSVPASKAMMTEPLQGQQK